MLKRAYSLLEVKDVTEEEDAYVVRGTATTPKPDRMKDVVDPMGATFAPTIPLLWQHDAQKPVGITELGKPTKKGIPFISRIPKVKEPGTLRDRIEEAVQSIRYKLVAAVSIGFRPLNDAIEQLADGGLHFLETEILELSLVTIPAQPDAKITGIKSIDDRLWAAAGHSASRSVKSIDTEQRAASGHTPSRVVRLTSPAGASAPKKSRAEEAKSMNLAEQIKSWEAKRAASVAAMEALMEKSVEAGTSLDAADEEKYDELDVEVKTVDKQLERLRGLEKIQAVKAKPVNEVKTVEGAADTRGGVIRIVETLPKGIEFARYVKCLAAARGNRSEALEIAKTQYPDMPRIHTVLKAAVAAGTTTDATWAAPLIDYQNFAGDFVEYLRPATIIGKFGQNGIPELRRVPFNIRMLGQTSGGDAYWVGQGAPKPLTKFDYNAHTLTWAKVANIAVLTDELVRFSNPSADALVRDALRDAIVERIDRDFIDPDKAAVANVSPASITNGVTPISSSGTTNDAINTDVQAAMQSYIDANNPPLNGVWIMSATTALSLSLMQNALGTGRQFPEISMNGGRFMGLPVIVSQYVTNATAGADVILVNASDIWLADDGQVVIDASREASLQMLDNPTNNSATATATTMVSMFQTNSVAIRAERWINWAKRRTSAVAYISGVFWGGNAT